MILKKLKCLAHLRRYVNYLIDRAINGMQPKTTYYKYI